MRCTTKLACLGEVFRVDHMSGNADAAIAGNVLPASLRSSKFDEKCNYRSPI